MKTLRSNDLSADEAGAVFDVLARYGQVQEEDHASFIAYASTGLDEWRFCGALGFGGKIRCWPVFGPAHRSRRVAVDCYPEDRTPERVAFVAFLNETLEAVVA